jgi:hypothetical protein
MYSYRKTEPGKSFICTGILMQLLLTFPCHLKLECGSISHSMNSSAESVKRFKYAAFNQLLPVV